MWKRFVGSRWVFQSCLSFCCLGQSQWSIVSTETWDQEKEHHIQQQSHKRPLLFAEATKFNNLQFNCCNCLFLSAGHTIVHYADLQMAVSIMYTEQSWSVAAWSQDLFSVTLKWSGPFWRLKYSFLEICFQPAHACTIKSSVISSLHL